MTKNTKFFRYRPLKILNIQGKGRKTGFIISEFINKCSHYYSTKGLRPTSSIIIYMNLCTPNLKQAKLSEKHLEIQFPGTLIQKYYKKRCSKFIKNTNLVRVKRLLI